MRYNISSNLSISLFLIVIWLYRSFNCIDICKHLDPQHYHKQVFENDTYHLSLHYNYLLRISRHQLVLNGNFHPFPPPQHITTKFIFQYYNNDVDQIVIYRHRGKGLIEIFNDKKVGTISNYIRFFSKFKLKVFSDDKLFAVKSSFIKKVKNKEITAKITNVIYPNGKILFYYENIPKEIKGRERKSKITGDIKCETGNMVYEIDVPVKRIKTGTLVEYEPIGNICPKYNSIEECQYETTCIWLKEGNICIPNNDKDKNHLIENELRIQNSSDVNVLSPSTTIKHNETTSNMIEIEVVEKLNGTSEETVQHSNSSDVNVLSPPTTIKYNETTSKMIEDEFENILNGIFKETVRDSNTTAEFIEDRQLVESAIILFLLVILMFV
uniref:Egg protein CP391S-like protein n=1 Tax=Schistosoma mansoni TaxID=6183 RepID=A0A5K4FDW1_SCHMA